MKTLSIACLFLCGISTAELYEAHNLALSASERHYETNVVASAHSNQGDDCAEFRIEGDHGLNDNNVTWRGDHLNVRVYACGASRMVAEYYLPGEIKRRFGFKLRGKFMKGYETVILGEGESDENSQGSPSVPPRREVAR